MQIQIPTDRTSGTRTRASDVDKHKNAWHGTLRERLVRTSKDSYQYDEKWGFGTQSTFKCQSPLPFSYECGKTYETPEKEKCLDQSIKRKFWKKVLHTDHLLQEGEQPRVSIIFRGKG